MTNSLFIALVVVAIMLSLELYRRAGLARVSRFKAARRSTSHLVGSGQLVVGTRRRAVALAVTDTTLFYERSGLQASVELDSVLAIEYDTVLAAGVDVREGRVLRLRSASDTIEFVLPREDVSNWYQNLPPRPEKAGLPVVPWMTQSNAPPTAPLVWLR